MKLSSDATIELVEYVILNYLDFIINELNDSREKYILDNRDSFHRDASTVFENIVNEFENRLKILTIDNTIHYEFDEEENKVFPKIILKPGIAREDLFFTGLGFIDFLNSMIFNPDNIPIRNSKNIICEDRAIIYKLAKDSLIWRLETICDE